MPNLIDEKKIEHTSPYCAFKSSKRHSANDYKNEFTFFGNVHCNTYTDWFRDESCLNNAVAFLLMDKNVLMEAGDSKSLGRFRSKCNKIDAKKLKAYFLASSLKEVPENFKNCLLIENNKITGFYKKT